MEPQAFIQGLAGGPAIVRALIADLPEEALHVRPASDQWSIRDVLCHLADEERYDFRPRLEATWRGYPWPRNHPSREAALEEYARADPIVAGAVDWEITCSARWGTLRAGDLLVSWAAHYIHHQRQIIRLRYRRLETLAEPYGLEYAGEW